MLIQPLKSVKKELFLTYEGILSIVFVIRNNKNFITSEISSCFR